MYHGPDIANPPPPPLCHTSADRRRVLVPKLIKEGLGAHRYEQRRCAVCHTPLNGHHHREGFTVDPFVDLTTPPPPSSRALLEGERGERGSSKSCQAVIGDVTAVGGGGYWRLEMRSGLVPLG